jgi:predicted transcriptional regulator
MASTRTQIYLTERQRTKLDRIAQSADRSLASVIREAVDGYLETRAPEGGADALDSTFGALPDLHVPSRDEWDRG